jgi:REP element-mobilizing transposase RayT
MLRGNGGQPIFFADEDRCRFYLLLQEGTARFGYRVHGFCLMGNHVHLAIQVGEVPLSKSMQNLSFRYTRWINQHQKRFGHLFQGRYHAILVDQDRYLLELVRYIHLNPVRAELVEHPEDYAWSGHRAYLNLETLPWLTTDWVLSQFGRRTRRARQRYERFVAEGVESEQQTPFDRGGGADSRVLGEDDFVNRVLSREATAAAKPPSLECIIQRICQAYGLSETQLAAIGQRRLPARARALAGFIAVQTGAESLTGVATRFRRDVATLSIGVRRLTDKLRAAPADSDPGLSVLEHFNVRL